jgi:hypothetical protein
MTQGTCRVCGRSDVDVTVISGTTGTVCVDVVACFTEYRRRQGWNAPARMVEATP